MAYFYLQNANINIMRQKRQSFIEQSQNSSNRFLIRHSSSSVLNIFGCCSHSSPTELQSPHPEKHLPHKISIKSALKKSAIFGVNGNTSINESKFYPHAKKQWNFQSSNMLPNRRCARQSQMNESLMHNPSQKTIPSRKSQKINFVYNKQQSDRSIHNYQTNNYFLEKYIVHPQQINVFLKDQQPQIATFQPQGYDYGRRKEFSDNQPYQSNYKWNKSHREQINTPKFSANYEGNANVCHFSFGQHQKKMLMNKLTGFKQASSNRPSKDQGKADNAQQYACIDNGYEMHETSNFFKLNKRQNLSNIVRDVQMMDEQINDSSSGKSEVIDSYQNIMSRIQQKSTIIHLSLDK